MLSCVAPGNDDGRVATGWEGSTSGTPVKRTGAGEKSDTSSRPTARALVLWCPRCGSVRGAPAARLEDSADDDDNDDDDDDPDGVRALADDAASILESGAATARHLLLNNDLWVDANALQLSPQLCLR